ncbi:uncharacterized protein LOC118557824 isoform X2 [Fundulus heteroclitus]|uniref:uncharacterized protein LOC118557824 isoform X2 n=1 Tax=Fundulus heteroclitus TaxID=8078 RepID=UPI00165BC707|nr:uncharacterized protein LOC118557824 isoform X2 [Fundulus heteroclitus]
MDALRISLLLLLPCFSCFLDGKETLVKTIGIEPDFTPICTNETSNIIMLIVCKIRTERSSGEECSLLYKDEGNFTNECDSRFTLSTRNQTVFLHLTSLTPADSGSYSCQCSKAEGTYFLHLNITVNADEVWSHSAGVTLPFALIAALLLLILLLVILGYIHRRYYCREQPQSSHRHPNEDFVDIEPYSTYIQKENGLYSTTVLPNY